MTSSNMSDVKMKDLRGRVIYKIQNKKLKASYSQTWALF
jgi:hypothetical protein